MIVLPFGGIEQDYGSAINKGLANSKSEYFYVLKADFSQAKLNKQILVTRAVLAAIFIGIAGAVFLLRKYLT